MLYELYDIINERFKIVHSLEDHMIEVGHRTRYPGPGTRTGSILRPFLFRRLKNIFRL